ncbi:MAG: hypothetical protein ACPGMR_02780 [Pontibacterium sp.]
MPKSYYYLFGGPVLAILIFAVCYLTSFAIVEDVTPNKNTFMSFGRELIAATIGAAIGSGFGAWVGADRAFKYDLKRSKSEENEAAVNALNKTIISFLLQLNNTKHIEKSLKDAPTSNPEHILLADYPEVTPADLASLVAVIDDPEFILQLHNAQQRYSQAIKSLKNRNQHFSNNTFTIMNNSDPQVTYAAQQLIFQVYNLFIGGQSKEMLSDVLSKHINTLHEKGTEKYKGHIIFKEDKRPIPQT